MRCTQFRYGLLLPESNDILTAIQVDRDRLTRKVALQLYPKLTLVKRCPALHHLIQALL
jgi:hypothetical protein